MPRGSADLWLEVLKRFNLWDPAQEVLPSSFLGDVETTRLDLKL